jgi:FkbM family methyltransferase
MGVLSKLELAAGRYRDWRNRRVRGPHGDFFRAGANEVLFADLPVDADSVVLDVGGYQGAWTAEMSGRYGCRSIILEPIPTFARRIKHRFARNRRVEVIAAGLGARDEVVQMTEAADGSSAAHGPGELVDAPLVGVEGLFAKHPTTDFACMKINIEGGEFDVLDMMIASDLCPRIRCFLIQFHRVSPDSPERRRAIQDGLSRTHNLRFDYEFLWERWDRR